MPIQTRVQIRRGTASQWDVAANSLGNGILYQGEIGYETDTGRFKIGDGSTSWGTLAYAAILPSGFIAGSGISLSTGSNGSTLTISLSDPSIQLSDITDLSSDARTFLTTPNSSNLKTLVTDETGSGPLVFSNNPVLSGVTVSGDLSVSGSGLLASNINNFDTQVRSSRLDQMTAPSGNVSFNNVRIINLSNPSDPQDAATKAYVDSSRAGLDVKQSVRVATTENIALSGLQTIDNVSVVADDRVLVKNQSNLILNGIYTVSAGSWSRSTDADDNTEVTAGMFTFVTEGNTQADSGWVLSTNDVINLGVTELSFAQFSGAGQIIAGSGLVKSGNTLDVVTASSNRIVVNADSIDLATVSQSDTTGSNGVSFVQSVTRDSYGRVTGVTSATVQDASTSAKGISSFDSGDFSVTSGVVSIKASGIDNLQLVNASVTIGSTSIVLGDTISALSGINNITSTTFTGSLSGNASTASALQTGRTINGTNFDGTSNIVISFVDGGTP